MLIYFTLLTLLFNNQFNNLIFSILLSSTIFLLFSINLTSIIGSIIIFLSIAIVIKYTNEI